jgi:hypothetical protein
VGFAAAPAAATPTLHVSASTGLTQKELVGVTGTGLAPGAYGEVLECNATPGEPTVSVGAPFDEVIPVGCSAPSLKAIVSTTAGGVLSTSFLVRTSKKIGPPCSAKPVQGPCAHFDSAGMHPRADAQNYPCPPTSAQRAAGVTCALVFRDTAGEVVSAPIAFAAG